jgi:hypothetical protein
MKPFNFSAKLSLKGVQYLDSRSINIGANTGAYISAAAAVIFGIATILLAISTNNKDKEIENLKANLSVTSAGLNRALTENENFKNGFSKGKQSLTAQLEKDSIHATSAASAQRLAIEAKPRKNGRQAK